MAEQRDVERLEARSLANFFYQVVGKMDAKMDKERVEAYAAEVRYDAAVRELETVTEDLRKVQQELVQLGDCEEEYFLRFQEKAQAMRAGGTPRAAELMQLDENIAYLQNQMREVDEALTVGQAAKLLADQVLASLDSAEGYGVWDMLGGGLIADALKYEKLDDAQRSIEKLQIQLRRFKTELADVTIDTDMHIGIDGFLQFADYFFDGLFTDWMVMDEISHSQERMKEVRSQIYRALSQLNTLKSASQQELDKETARRERLVVEHDT